MQKTPSRTAGISPLPTVLIRGPTQPLTDQICDPRQRDRNISGPDLGPRFLQTHHAPQRLLPRRPQLLLLDLVARKIEITPVVGLHNRPDLSNTLLDTSLGAGELKNSVGHSFQTQPVDPALLITPICTLSSSSTAPMGMALWITSIAAAAADRMVGNVATPTPVCSGMAASLRVISVTIPSVPSEPTKMPLRL